MRGTGSAAGSICVWKDFGIVPAESKPGLKELSGLVLLHVGKESGSEKLEKFSPPSAHSSSLPLSHLLCT